MTKPAKSRAERAAKLEHWATKITTSELVAVETSELQRIAEIAQRRDALDDELTAVVNAARRSGRSWSEIGMMLGVSKQAAQRKYGSKTKVA